MRILVSSITFLPTVGGAEMGIHEIYSRLGRDHDVVVVSPRPRGASESSPPQPASYESVELLPRAEELPRTAARLARRSGAGYLLGLSNVARSFRPEVLNPHFLERQGWASLAVGHYRKIPVVYSLVGRSDVMAKQRLVRRELNLALLRRSTDVMANSEYYLQGVEDAPRAQIVPYGVDLTRYAPSKRSADTRQMMELGPSDFAFVTVQRLEPVKRVDLLLRSLQMGLLGNPDLKLVVVGRGSQEDALRQLAGRLGIAKSVRFLGHVSEDDLPTVMASSDAFAFHSLEETFGIVFAQAMACGLPIVAAATSCVPLVVMPENGRLVEPHNIAAFSRAMIETQLDETTTARVRIANRKRAVEKFDWDTIAAQTERILFDAVQRRKRP